MIFDDRTLWLTCESKRCLYDYNTTAIKICLDTKIRNARTTIWQFFVSLIRYIVSSRYNLPRINPHYEHLGPDYSLAFNMINKNFISHSYVFQTGCNIKYICYATNFSAFSASYIRLHYTVFYSHNGKDALW